MEQENRSFRTGVIVLVTALVCRLLSAYLPAIPIQQEVASVLLFLETGRVIKYSYTPAETQPLTPQPLVFSPEDSALVQVSDREKYGVDVQAMLSRELSWDLTAEKPTVLILHSHATESYAETQSNGYHSTKAQENMLSIGACLAEILEESGISCIHDTTLHDKPSYNGAYTSSRTSIDDYLSRYPSIRLVLDLHRDSAVDAGGNRYAATVDTVYGESAKLMLVMATNASGQHPDWQDNVALGIKLQAVLEKQNAGICRSMLLRTSRYNQDLSPGALLIEVGADGNTQQQALNAVRALADAILTLAYGSSV